MPLLFVSVSSVVVFRVLAQARAYESANDCSWLCCSTLPLWLLRGRVCAARPGSGGFVTALPW